MLDARAGGHALGDTGAKHAMVAVRVAMLECTFEDPGDDFHVSVSVGVEPSAGGDTIVIRDDQQAVARVRRIMVMPETEAVATIEPAKIGVEAIVSAPHIEVSVDCSIE